MATQKVKIPIPKGSVEAYERQLIAEHDALLAKEREQAEKKKSKPLTTCAYFGTDKVQAIAYQMSDLYAKGYTDSDVAEYINTTYGFHWNLKKVQALKTLVRKFWRSHIVENMDEQIAEEVNACNVQIRELWKAWEFSKTGNKKTTTRQTHSSGGADEVNFDQDETVSVQDTSAGDTKIMAQIIEVGKEKRKLLGLYAPEKKISTGGAPSIQIAVVGSDGQASSSVLGSILDMAGKKERTVEDVQAEDVTVSAVNNEATMAQRELVGVNFDPEDKPDMDIEAMFNELSR